MISRRPEPTVENDASPRTRIISAAMDTISDRTISGMRMREVAERAGLGHGHVNYYFATRSDLLLAVLDHIWEMFADERDRLLEDPDLPASHRFGVFFDQQRRLLEERADLLSVRLDYTIQGISDKVIEDEIRVGYADWRARIAEQIEQSAGSDGISPDTVRIISDVCIAIMEGAVLQEFNEPERMDIGGFFRVAEEMVASYLESLAVTASAESGTLGS